MPHSSWPERRCWAEWTHPGTYTDSKSEVDGQFLGLPLDADNEGDQAQGRDDDWATQLRKESMPC